MATTFFGFSGAQATTTCSTSERPPAGCRTFANEDFSRVPFPAARITSTTSLFAIVRLFSPALAALTIEPWTERQNSIKVSARKSRFLPDDVTLEEDPESMQQLPGKPGRLRREVSVLRRRPTRDPVWWAWLADGSAKQQKGDRQPGLRRAVYVRARFDCGHHSWAPCAGGYQTDRGPHGWTRHGH